MENKKSEIRNNKKFYYVVDHQEGGLLDWCLAEYTQIMEYLNSSNSLAILTNANTLKDYTDASEELTKKMEECSIELAIRNKGKIQFVDSPLHSLLEKNPGYISLDSKSISTDKVCLLDMRADKALSSSDAEEFEVFVFGGILGDNPPKDRTSYLRAEGFKSRHLGALQMSTDTAVLTTKLIVEFGLDLDKIPSIDEPEFFKDKSKLSNNLSKSEGSFGYEESVTMEGFKFITDEINYNTGEIVKKENPKSLGNKDIYENLIFEEFDPSMFI